jgi:hypothetical protein
MSQIARSLLCGLVLVVMSQLTGIAQSDISLLLRIEHSGVVRISALVSPGQLSDALTVAYCRQVFSANPSTRVGIVELFEGPLPPGKVVTGSSHYSFKELLDLYDSYASRTWRSARCLLTPEHGTYVIRLGGTIGKGLLYGSEFPQVVVSGLRADAIHVSPGIPLDRAVIDGLTVFVLAERIPSPEHAADIAAYMRSYFGPTVRIVNIQDRPVFPFHEEFPVYPVYTSSERPATKRDYYRQYLSCGLDRVFKCRDAL